jgi:hypothetical protein
VTPFLFLAVPNFVPTPVFIQAFNSISQVLNAQMTILGRHPWILVTEQMLHPVQVTAALDKLRRKVMPQVMEPEVLDACPYACPPECH